VVAAQPLLISLKRGFLSHYLSNYVCQCLLSCSSSKERWSSAQ